MIGRGVWLALALLTTQTLAQDLPLPLIVTSLTDQFK